MELYLCSTCVFKECTEKILYFDFGVVRGLILECDAVCLAELLPTFRKNVIPPSLSWIPRSWKMKVLCVFEKTKAAAPNSTAKRPSKAELPIYNLPLRK